MRKAFQILAIVIALEIPIQAAMIAFALGGMTYAIDNKGLTVDHATFESWKTVHPTFTGSIGHPIHQMNGEYLIPLLAIVLLVVSFFAKVPKGPMFAGIIVVLVALQALAGLSHLPYALLFHGFNAFLIFGAAIAAARAARLAKTAG